MKLSLRRTLVLNDSIQHFAGVFMMAKELIV
jgi:hypothetical protein